MYLAAIFLPFLNFCFCCIYGRFLGRVGVTQLSILLLGLSFLFSIIGFGSICSGNETYYIDITSWIDCSLFFVRWGFLLDSLSVSMLAMVSFISLMVHLYSSSYMESDPSYPRFMGYLSLFTFLMFILVTSDNFIQLFFGWEGIGLCSYLLISFWNTRIQANKSALKALIMNRLGDLGFLVGTVLIFYLFRSVDFSTVFALAPLFENTTVLLGGFEVQFVAAACFWLFIGSCGKSAQIGLHTWLPDAMEGPTPVSALIHAATLVTAGVFLVIRCSSLFETAPSILTFITLIGAFTALFASSIGLFQYDIKKVIAFSTCSQLGYMVFICGLSGYQVSLFHLINHAFFKALLFLTAGVIIHALSGEQDMRKMGSLLNILPFTYNALLIGSLALIGFPFLSGFYSKDFLLETAFASIGFESQLAFWLGTLSASFTAFYSFRVLYLAFYMPNASNVYYAKNLHELPVVMGIVLLSLSLGSIFFGYLAKDIFVGFGSSILGGPVYVNPLNLVHFDVEFVPFLFKNMPTIFTTLGLIFGYYTYFISQIFHYENIPVHIVRFFNNKWYFDYLYNGYFGYPYLNIAYWYNYILLDKGFLELLGAFGISNIISSITNLFKTMHQGSLNSYINCMVISYSVIIIAYFYSIF